MNNILYIGAHPTTWLVRESHGKLDSLYRDSQALIDGFKSLKGINIKVITSPDIASFPKNKPFFKSYYDDTDETLAVSSLNIVGLKQFWTAISMSHAARKIIRSNNEKTTVIIPYMVFRHVLAASIVKLICGKQVQVCIVIPDVFFPQTYFSKVINKVTEFLSCKFDFFILYTEAMAKYLNIEDKKHITMEGFHKVNIQPITKTTEKFVITYAGSLNICYGIGRLLDAFKSISYQDVELHLYGRGDADEMIKEHAKFDARIKYFGLVPKEQATAALFKSTLLINPRNATDGEFVQYSFPSKDIDYLASGVPCVLCKLPGMPKEYYGHFIDAGDGSAESLAAAIKDAYSMTPAQREYLAIKAQQFISERMDTKKQAERIIQLINS